MDGRGKHRMLTLTAFGPGGARPASLSEVSDLLRGEAGQWIWVDITDPTDEDVRLLEQQFRFHPLAIEDTRNQHQRPTIADYGDHLFLIVNPVGRSGEGVAFRELDIFLGANRLVTVHLGPEPIIAAARQRIGQTSGANVPTPGYVLYALVDAIVDGYFPVLDEIGDQADTLEDAVLASPNQTQLAELFQMKRDLIALRKMFNVLLRRDHSHIDNTTLQYYLRDVYDHLLRATDLVDTMRDLLSNTVELYLSAASYRLNQVVNRLTALTIIIGVLAVITGFFGMNLPLPWPARDASTATLPVLAVMLASVLGLLALFRRAGWL